MDQENQIYYLAAALWATGPEVRAWLTKRSEYESEKPDRNEAITRAGRVAWDTNMNGWTDRAKVRAKELIEALNHSGVSIQEVRHGE